jgi:hypothetical protein
MTGWLFLHLIGVVLSIDNFIVTAFWKIRADSQKIQSLYTSPLKTL